MTLCRVNVRQQLDDRVDRRAPHPAVGVVQRRRQRLNNVRGAGLSQRGGGDPPDRRVVGVHHIFQRGQSLIGADRRQPDRRLVANLAVWIRQPIDQRRHRRGMGDLAKGHTDTLSDAWIVVAKCVFQRVDPGFVAELAERGGRRHP